MPRPNIFVTPPAAPLPKLPGFEPYVRVTGTRTEFSADPIAGSSSLIFVPSAHVPENIGFI